MSGQAKSLSGFLLIEEALIIISMSGRAKSRPNYIEKIINI
jgi:hypothetical protein